jgi:hypothetical protein
MNTENAEDTEEHGGRFFGVWKAQIQNHKAGPKVEKAFQPLPVFTRVYSMTIAILFMLFALSTKSILFSVALCVLRRFTK